MKSEFWVLILMILGTFMVIITSKIEVSKNLEKFDVPKNKIEEWGKNKKLVVCGLAQNSEDNVDNIIELTDKLRKIFGKVELLVVENNSKDNTREKYLSKKGVTVLGCGVNQPGKCSLDLSGLNRTEKMSYLRNIYLDYLENSSGFDWCLMVDLDIRGDIFEKSIYEACDRLRQDETESSINEKHSINESINVLCPNSMMEDGVYYDTFALNTHSDRKNKFLSERNFLNTSHPERTFWAQKEIVPGEKAKLIEVESCFGGMVFYRVKSLLGKRYRVDPDGFQCEHHHLNRDIRGVFIDPNFIIKLDQH